MNTKTTVGSSTGRTGKPRNKWRRRFLITAGAVGGVLAIGTWRFYGARDQLSPPADLTHGDGEAVLTGWLKIDTNGNVIVQVPRQEMGQGITTSLPMLVAEELDADPALVRFEQALVDPLYANATLLGDGVPMRPDDTGLLASLMRTTQFKLGELLGIQATGGSTSIRDAWTTMRRAGAAARAMLVQAAATRFNVPIEECTVADGVIEHAASGKRANFGEVALDAAGLPIPRNIALKDPAQFKLIGTSQKRLDIPAKVDGSASFGLDVRIPGMLYAAIAQSPVFGGSVNSIRCVGRRCTRKGVKGVFEPTGHQHLRCCNRSRGRTLLAGS